MRTHLLVVIAVVSMTPRAFADDAAHAATRRAAEQLAIDAGKNHDDAMFVACGQAYLELYNQAPQVPEIDEILYNASVCFHLGKSVSAELQTGALVLKYSPRSRLVAKVLRSSAATYASIAYFDQAASRLEEYATKFAGEKDAPDALADAARYRAALGDTAQWSRDTKQFVRDFGRHSPREAAAAAYALVGAHDGAPDDAIKELRAYLKDFGPKLDADDAIVAHVRLGDLLSASSCPVPTIDGLCITLVRDRLPRCGPATILKVAIVKRAAGRSAALDEYKQAIALFAKTPKPTSPRMAHAAAMAKLALADDDLERMFEAWLPADLDFDPAPAHKAAKTSSMKRFEAWVAKEQATARVLVDQYFAILELKDADSSVAAAARIGQTVEAFWRALLVGEIPKAFRTGELAKDKLDAYCDQLRVVAEPLAARAVEAFEVCQQKATELGMAHPWLDVCLREGQVIAPEKFQDGHELHALSSFAPTALMLERPMR
jgi:tetratricopeptide (TPR) repeat protein